MRCYKLDFVCKDCYYNHQYVPHRCKKEVYPGDAYNTYVKTGRIGLSRDGLTCKYYQNMIK